MSKKEKSFAIEIKEAKDGDLISNEVFINHKMIGKILEKGDNEFIASNLNNDMKVKTLDEGIQWVIAEFNLHAI